MTPRRIAIFKPDGTRHGGFGREIPLDVMERELCELGFRPHEPQKRLLPGNNFRLGGLATGCCNVYEIDETELLGREEMLRSAGFAVWPERSDPVSPLYDGSFEDGAESEETVFDDEWQGCEAMTAGCETADPSIAYVDNDAGALDELSNQLVRICEETEYPNSRAEAERVKAVLSAAAQQRDSIWPE